MPRVESARPFPVAVDASGPFEVRFWQPGWPKWAPGPARTVPMGPHYRGKRKRNAGRHHGAGQ